MMSQSHFSGFLEVRCHRRSSYSSRQCFLSFLHISKFFAISLFPFLGLSFLTMFPRVIYQIDKSLGWRVENDWWSFNAVSLFNFVSVLGSIMWYWFVYLKFSNSCFACVIGTWHKLLDVVFKNISSPEKFIVP